MAFSSPDRRGFRNVDLDEDSQSPLRKNPEDILKAQLLNASKQMQNIERMFSEHKIPIIDKSNEIHEVSSPKLDVNPIDATISVDNGIIVTEEQVSDRQEIVPPYSSHQSNVHDINNLKDSFLATSVDYLQEDHEVIDDTEEIDLVAMVSQKPIILSVDEEPCEAEVQISNDDDIDSSLNERGMLEGGSMIPQVSQPSSQLSEQLDKIRLIANYYDDKQRSILAVPEEKNEGNDAMLLESHASKWEDHTGGRSVWNPSSSPNSPPRLNQSSSRPLSSTQSSLRHSLQDMELHDLYSDHENRFDQDDLSQTDSVQEKNNLLLRMLNNNSEENYEGDGRYGHSKPFHEQISIPENPLANERSSMIRSKSVEDADKLSNRRRLVQDLLQENSYDMDQNVISRANIKDSMTTNPMLLDKRELQRGWDSGEQTYDGEHQYHGSEENDDFDPSEQDRLNGQHDASPQRLLNPLTEVVRVDVNDQNRYSTPNRGHSKSRNSSPLSTISAVNSAVNNEKPIKIVIRVRPFTDFEYDHKAKRTISKSGPDLIIVNPNAFDVEPDMIAKAAMTVNDKQWAQPFRFDDCLWSYDPTIGRPSYVDQLGVYESIGSDVVENVMNGISCTCFAYGSSGTGKTYTLFGASRSAPNGARSKSPASMHRSLNHRGRDSDDKITSESGIAPRVFVDIVNTVKCSRVKLPYGRIFFSFIELYNEKVVDLLVDSSDASTISSVTSHNNGGSSDNMKVREHPIYGPYVENLRKIEIFSVEDILRLIARGQRNRSTTKTLINPESSRSHVICTLELANVDLNLALRPEKTVWTKREPMKKLGTPNHVPLRMDLDTSASAFNTSAASALQGPTGVIKVQMVDLAGSDKLGSDANVNATHVSEKSPGRYGMTTDPTIEKEKVELKMIRRSLNTLSQIVQSLGKGVSFRSLPYRDSILTFLLRDALNGYNHTTMIATISPSHLSYDETIATLRYAEKLCLIRKKSLSQLALSAQSTIRGPQLLTNGAYHDLPQTYSRHQHDSDPNSQLVMQSKPELEEEFRRFHQDLGSAKKGTLAARQLLQHTISDPQQRIAKLTRNMDMNQSQQGAIHNNHSRHSTPKKSSYSRSIPSDVTFTSPIDGTVRRLKELTGDDLEHLQSSYRNLQGQVIELQIDLDSLRTDRDSMVVELRGARDHINELEQEKYDLNMRNQNMNKSIQAAEKELNDLRGLIRRREEALERIMNELNEEKQARVNAEQAYHTRTNDFLTRFDNLKKENKMLQNALEVSRSRDGFSGVEKQQLLEQISELQNTLADQSRTLHATQKENSQLRDDLSSLSIKSTKFDEIAPKHQALQEEKVDLFSKLDKLRGDYEVLLAERNSLSSLVEQKDSLLWLQSQQAEANTKLLQSQIQQLQLQQQTMIKSEDWQRMQENIRNIFANESEVLYHEITDTKKLTSMIKDLHEKSKYYEKIQRKLEKENQMRKELEGKLVESVNLLKSEEVARQEQEDLSALLEKELIEAVKTNGYAIKNAQIRTIVANHIKSTGGAGGTQTLSNLHNLSSLLPHDNVNLDDDATVTHLVQQLEQARSDNAYLLGQLEATQKENLQLKDDLTNTQASMQKEFSSLWMSVQELNKLDALKDKSIQDLVAERSQIAVERDLAHEKLKSLSSEIEQMKRVMPDVDQDLQHTTNSSYKGLSTISPSPINVSTGYPRSISPADLQRRNTFHMLANSSVSALNSDESEQILERQIEELSDFLQDEERLKRARSNVRPQLASMQSSNANQRYTRQRKPTPSSIVDTMNRFR